jgi:hypothetical protein
MSAVKAKEKEMKEEKEAERQVSGRPALERTAFRTNGLWTIANIFIEEDNSAQGQACCEGGEGAIREASRDDAQEEGGEAEEEGEEEQDDQVMMEIALISCIHGLRA